MTIKNLSILVLLVFNSVLAFAFSVEDHALITEVAIEELKECGLLPLVMKQPNAADIVVKANVREDNYLINGFKKTFTYSHFYNPLRPLAAEGHRAFHADQAVLDYTSRIKTLEKNNPNPKDILENAGMITHMVQDASSPPHVQWINHAMFDGFENKVKVSRLDMTQDETDCAQINLAGLSSPMQIMKAAGLATLKELEEEVQYQKLSGHEMFTMTWSKGFFNNAEVYTAKVLQFLRAFDFNHPALNSPATDDEGRTGWNTEPLPRGEYGEFSDDISNVTLRGDNFGKANFEHNGLKYHVSPEQYLKLRKTLMRQSVLSTQRIILWLGTAKESTALIP